METLMQRRIVLAARPMGMPALTDFRLEHAEVADPTPGHVEVTVDVLSIDAFIRTVMEARSYHQSLPIGTQVPALAGDG